MTDRRRAPLALCYHGVGDVPVRRDRSRLFVRPRDLQRQIETLRRWGFQLVTFGELAARAREHQADNLAALTFDDGFVDNLTVLAPLLRSAAVPATVFIVSDWFGQPHPDAPWTRTMTEDELRALSRAGVEVGGHSRTHVHLPDLDPTDATDDMRRCRLDLEAVIDRAVSVFAYPYGGANEQTMIACEAAGYHAACRSGGVGNWMETFNLPRQDMQNRDSAIGFWLKRDDRYERAMRRRPSLALRRAFRLARSVRP